MLELENVKTNNTSWLPVTDTRKKLRVVYRIYTGR
jgi:hypothetical protein